MKIVFIDEDKDYRLAFEQAMKSSALPHDYSSAASFAETTAPNQFDIIIYHFTPDGVLPELSPETRLIVTAEGKVMEQALSKLKSPAYSFLIRDPERAFIKTLPAIVGAIYRQKTEEEKSHELSTIIEQTSDSLFTTNLDGIIEHVNEGFEKLFGYTRAEAVGKTPAILKSDKHNKSFYQTFWNQLKSGNIFRAVFINKSKVGDLLYIEQTVTPVKDKNGAIIRYVSTGRDITATGQTEQALQEANEKLIVWLDELEQRDTEISLLSEMSKALQACYNTKDAYVTIGNFAQKLFPNDSGALYMLNEKGDTVSTAAIWGTIKSSTKESFAPVECRALKSGLLHVAGKTEGEINTCSCGHLKGPVNDDSICAPMIAQGESLGLIYLQGNPAVSGQPEEVRSFLFKAKQRLASTVAENVGLALANIQLREKLRYQATRDPLTNLFNRRFLEETLSLQMFKAKRSGISIGIIMFDIDHFKVFNDTYGHAAGDAMLTALGNFLKANTRASDIACRYGGEEFIMIMPDATAKAAAVRAETLRLGVKELKTEYDNKPLSINLSFGVAAFPEHGDNVDMVIRCADSALYKAKESGRNRVEIYTPEK
jgi:diguanylate cyclase (GGDEF)-like protein/PAS domain S-box-containing protein